MAATAKDLQFVNQDFVEHFQAHKSDFPIEKLNEKLYLFATQFNKFDDDGSGDLDLDELTRMMDILGAKKSKKEIIHMVNEVDDDNSGTIRYREFVNLMLIHEGILKTAVQPEDDLVTPAARKMSMMSLLRLKKLKERNQRGAVRKPKRGHIKLETSLSNGTLKVCIKEAKDLLPCDFNGLSDPYVKLYLEPDQDKSSKQKTKVVKKSLSPVWNEEFTYKITPDMMGRRLHVTMWDWDRLSANDFMGSLSLTLKQIETQEIQTSGWFKLLDKEQGSQHAFPSRASEVGAGEDSVTHVIKSKGAHSKHQLSDFTILKVLGRGSFGKVFLAEEKSTKKQYALKALKKFAVFQDDDVAATMTERRVLTLGGNPPFLARMYAGFQTDANLFFVMELITGGDLMFHVLKEGNMPERATNFYAAEVCCGLWFLHERGILYRDLKLDNVMIDAEGHVKLADFGLAKEGLAPGGTTHTFCGTPDYIAPEIIQYLPYGVGIDFWSLGVMLYEMLTGEPPFDGESEEELFASILTKRIKCPRWLRADTALFIRGLLQRVPANRLGATVKTSKEEIQQHKYFAKVDWEQVENRKMKPPIVPKKGPAGCNFDPEFTKDKAVITPTEPRDLKKIDQAAFAGFTFVPGTVEEHVVHRAHSSTLL